MNFIDVLIIYLACGTPFAIYRIALSEHGPRETVVRSTRAGILWPMVGAKTVLKKLRMAPRFSGQLLRREMEEALSAALPDLRTFKFREVFDRYSSLAIATASKVDPASVQVFDIAKVRAGAASTNCLARINGRKLDRHLSVARGELMEYVLSSGSAHVADLAVSLAKEVGDPSLVAELAARGPLRTRRSAVSLPGLSGSAS
jgi:hypothetical protein